MIAKYQIYEGAKRQKTKLAMAFSAVAVTLLAVAAVTGLNTGNSLAASTLVVDDDHIQCPSAAYTSIQAAVTAASSGDTIQVCAGIYNEDVTIPTSLTLNGAQSGVDARTRVAASESIINGNVTIAANNVTVDGFTVNGPVSSGSAAFVLQASFTGETVKNNIINNPGRAASIQTSNTLFRQNKVNNTSTASDGFQGNSVAISNVTIADNKFSGATANNYNADVTFIEGSSNLNVTGNNSTGDGTLVAFFKTNGGMATGNTVVGDLGASAIYIGGGNSNITVSGNNVSGASAAVSVSNAFGVGVNSNISITGNNLHNNTNGIRIGTGAITAANTVVAHQNQLTGNSDFGFNNISTVQANATCNWWGAANGPGPVGPGTGDKVTTNVTFAPWLISANGACAGGNVVTNKDQCKNDGWMTLSRSNNTGFKNQGDCVSYTNTGR